jgi:hypothetical protein
MGTHEQETETATTTTHNKPQPPPSTYKTYLKLLRCSLLNKESKHKPFYFPDSNVIILLIDILYTPSHPSFSSNHFESAYSNCMQNDLVMQQVSRMQQALAQHFEMGLPTCAYSRVPNTDAVDKFTNNSSPYKEPRR